MPRLYRYCQSDVTEAAERTLAHILRLNHGDLALTFKQAWKMAFRCGLSVRLVEKSPDFTAETRENPANGRWTIYINQDSTERQRIRYIVHELAECICITHEPDFAGLYDDIPGSRTLHYNGGDDPSHVRHRVAMRTERIYLHLMKQARQVERLSFRK